jgi:hypothetical protein
MIRSATLLCGLGLLAANAWAQPVRIASWNLEWLADAAALEAADFWQACASRGWPNATIRPSLPPCDAYRKEGITTSAQYRARKLAPLRAGLAALAARGIDILAVQEAQSPAALAAVLPAQFRVACFTTRRDAQNVGIAVRRGARLDARCRELRSLSLEHERDVRAVRRGLELRFTAGARTVHLLNVHLKARCAVARLDTPGDEHCRTLQRQVPVLERWVEAQAGAFMIVGDWNRDLEKEVDMGYRARSDGSDAAARPSDARVIRNVFPEINDGMPARSAMELVRVERRAAALRGCRDVLDQLVVSATLVAALTPAAAPHARLVPGPAGSSDHCSLEVTLMLKGGIRP